MMLVMVFSLIRPTLAVNADAVEKVRGAGGTGALDREAFDHGVDAAARHVDDRIRVGNGLGARLVGDSMMVCPLLLP